MRRCFESLDARIAEAASHLISDVIRGAIQPLVDTPQTFSDKSNLMFDLFGADVEVPANLC